MKLFSHRPLVALSILGLTLAACGGKSGKNQDDTTPPPSADVSEVGKANGKPKVDNPATDPGEPTAPRGPVDIGTLQLVDAKVDLSGDFRVKKVQRDAAGHFYAAFVSDVTPAGGAGTLPGYALFKFDETGKELWRFPTLESGVSDGVAGQQQKVGSYLLGALADMHVSPDGEIWLIGVKTFEATATGSNASLIGNWDKSGYDVGNTIFLSLVGGDGVTADSPSQLSFEMLAAPVWLTPHAIRKDANGEIVIESSSPTTGGDAFVHNIQRIASDFSTVVASACFVGQGVSPASGPKHLINLAYAAPSAIVSMMTAAIVPAPKTEGEEFFRRTAAVFAQRANTGRCWDLLGSHVMAEGVATTHINRPSALVEGQPLTSRIESLDDLFSATNSFEEYEVSNVGISGSKSWAPNLNGSQTATFEIGYARWFAHGDEVMHAGLDTQDLLSKTNLVVGNGRTVAAKAWKHGLQTTSQRSPGSLDMISLRSAEGLVAAWTDLHPIGETNEGSRGLRLAHLPADGSAPQIVKLGAPEKVGHNSYSSVRLVDSADGRLVVFATIGTRNPASAPAFAKMDEATLLIGFTK